MSREWRAQIERCLDSGLRVSFLNSHEHLHMLPALFPVARRSPRITRSRIFVFRRHNSAVEFADGSLFAAQSMKTLETINRRRLDYPDRAFSRFGASGKLDLPYLDGLSLASCARARSTS